jgi:ADP-heptose:LPS heptosyltransferase
MTAPAPESARRGHVLLARLDSLGDLLLAGPAVRAVAGSAAKVTMLVGEGRREDASLLPCIDEVIEFAAPWVVFDPGPVQPQEMSALITTVQEGEVDAALILTSFHQSPLPLALLLRMAGVGWIGAISEDYPGSLLDLRHRIHQELPEPERNLSLAQAAGFLPDEQGARLSVRRPLPEVTRWTGSEPYLVFHPGASTSSRRPTAKHSRHLVRGLVDAGYRVIITGSASEVTLAAYVADGRACDLSGQLDLAHLAAVLDRAQVVVAPNTGPAHLAAAVETPVVSLFAPVVPATRWAPYGIPMIILGDQEAACRDSRARTCPLPGHPCLSSIGPEEVVDAVGRLAYTGVGAP